jgi:hypothetical protein
MTGATAPSWQAGFGAALLDPDRPRPAGLRAWNGVAPVRRFAVHRNNVVAALVAALRASFPVVQRLVGDAFFDAAARLYACAHPPRSPVLAEYGDDFAAWLACFEPARALPYLPDMARLEHARARAFHAADAPALEAAEITAQLADPQLLPLARPVLHPSCSVIVSPFDVPRLWAAHQADGEVPPVDVDAPAAALVLRDPHDDVLVVALPVEGGRFCQALLAGRSLGAAMAAAGDAGAAAATRFDLSVVLSILIRHGALVGWRGNGACE